jgi:hypothetical protein
VSADAQRFSVLALLYLVTNARVGSSSNRRRVQRVMARPEREAVTAVLERLPATVVAWSDGLAALEPMHIVEVRRPLSSLSSSGEGRWWAGPRDCREELAELISDRPYDSVIVLWPSAPDLPLCGWGCSVGPSEATFGAGFSSIESGHWPTLATSPDPEQGYVHEWLHQVEAIYRTLGVDQAQLPDLHAAADFTSTRPIDEPPFGRSYAEYHEGSDAGAGIPALPAARTWAPWYRDWMTGRLRRLGGDAGGATAGVAGAGADASAGGASAASAARSTPLGLTPERWARRSA